MAPKPSYEELQKKVESLEKKVKRHRKREDVFWRIQERLTQIIESIPIPTFVLDREHVVIHYNPAIENLTGIAYDEISGTRDAWKAFYNAARPTMADLIVDGAPEQEIARYYRGKYRKSKVKEGAYEAEDFFPDIGDGGRWLYFTAAPLMDSEGNVMGALETLQDTTERRRAIEERLRSEQGFRTLLDFAPYSILVFSMDGLVTYLNPAFTEVFGWTLEELQGKRIPYVPVELIAENRDHLRKLMAEKVIRRYETRRLTKDGRSLDVVWRASVFEDAVGEPAGVLVILRDITRVKRIARNNEAMLRISMALPEYPELYELLDFVSGIIKELMETEGGLVILLDEQRQELFLRGAAYDDSATQQRAKETRFLVDELVAGKVIETGQPIVLNDIPADSKIHNARDKKLGYQTRNLLLVPLKSQDRTIGTLCAVNKKEGDFDQADQELLSMLAGTVVLSIENARFSAELKKAYMEVSSLNRAKDKVINHLSHELKTPIAVLRTSLVTLEKRLKSLPEKSWRSTVDRARRNIDRLLEMQYQVHDIIQHKTYKPRKILSHMVAHCADELEALIAEQIGDDSFLDGIHSYINETYGTNEMVAQTIQPHAFIRTRLEYLRPFFAHRDIDVNLFLKAAPDIFIPVEAFQKIFDGLMKNAVENTPDEGRLDIIVKPKGDGVLLQVCDFGVGITPENQAQIFDGFFTTRETMDYSSKKPFDFNAGGKGSDLLRIKIFAERYGFEIKMNSTRCPLLPKDSETCPGRISACSHCNTGGGCHEKVATIFSLYFPPAASVR